MRENAEYIEINDFTPGIYSDYHYDSGATPAETSEGNILQFGAATVDDTYRCHADKSGALAPLPKLTAGKTQGILPTASNASDRYSGHASYLMDGMVRGANYVQTEQPAVVADRAAVFVMYGQWYKPTGDANFKWLAIAQLHRLFEGTASTDQQDLMWAKCSEQVNTNTHIGAGNFMHYRVRESVTDASTQDCTAWVAYGAPGYGYVPGAWTTGAIPAGELTLTDFDTWTGTEYPGEYQRVIGIYPDPRNATVTSNSGFLDSSYDGIVGEAFADCCLMVGHQGRMVGVTRAPKQRGSKPLSLGADSYYLIGEAAVYSPVQDFYGTLGFGCFETLQFAEEKPYRTGAVSSISADEIIFIKDRGGAVLIRGDLDNPTVVQLPYVESTQGARCLPATTNFGLVYGTSNGIYLWEGGETARHLSPQIDGWFWNHDTTLEYLGNRGRFAWWNPFVCVPNNYLYDSIGQGWWRLEDPALTSWAFSAYDVADITNTLYAFPYKLTSTSASVMWYTANPAILSDTYSWKSQPLAQSRNRVMTLQEVHLFVTPSSTTPATITITLTAIDKNGAEVTPVVTTFTTTGNTNPQMLHKDLVTNIQGTHIQVKIEANSNLSSAPAPKIHSVKFATAPRARVAKG